MITMRTNVYALVAAASLVGATVPARADDFYKNKTVTIIVGFSPGGGFDAYARLLAEFLGKYIPGRPNVIVQNMPGAGSQTAVVALDKTQPQDGTVMTIFNPGLITRAIVQPKVVHLDFRKLAWVGVATPDFRVCYGYDDKGPKTWSQLMHGKPFILGSTAKGSGNYVNGRTLKVIFDAPIKQILGFPGSAEQRIAIEQGELDGDCGSVSSIPPKWIETKVAHMFVRFTKKRPSFEPASAKFINDFAKTQGQKELVDFLDASNEVGRPFVMSSKVPAERLAIIRKAFDAAMNDPALVAQANKEQIPVSPISGAQAEKIVAKQMSEAKPDLIKKAREIYQ